MGVFWAHHKLNVFKLGDRCYCKKLTGLIYSCIYVNVHAVLHAALRSPNCVIGHTVLTYMGPLHHHCVFIIGDEGILQPSC